MKKLKRAQNQVNSSTNKSNTKSRAATTKTRSMLQILYLRKSKVSLVTKKLGSTVSLLIVLINFSDEAFKASMFTDFSGKKNHDYYFGSYSNFYIHEEMLKDSNRTRAYQQAIENNP